VEKWKFWAAEASGTQRSANSSFFIGSNQLRYEHETFFAPDYFPIHCLLGVSTANSIAAAAVQGGICVSEQGGSVSLLTIFSKLQEVFSKERASLFQQWHYEAFYKILPVSLVISLCSICTKSNIHKN